MTGLGRLDDMPSLMQKDLIIYNIFKMSWLFVVKYDFFPHLFFSNFMLEMCPKGGAGGKVMKSERFILWRVGLWYCMLRYSRNVNVSFWFFLGTNGSSWLLMLLSVKLWAFIHRGQWISTAHVMKTPDTTCRQRFSRFSCNGLKCWSIGNSDLIQNH